MKRFFKNFLCLMMLSIISLTTHAGWKQIGQRDLYRVVVVDVPDTDKTSVYWEALRTICSERNYCNVVFFSSDATGITTGSKRFSDDDLKKSLLIYNKGSGFIWNCQIRPEADNCFKY